MIRIFWIHLCFCLSVYSYSQDNTSSINDIEAQSAKFEKDGNNVEFARCQVKLGFLYHEKNNLQKSIECFQKALKINETLGNANAIKVISSNLGILYAESDQYDQALVYLRKSRELNEKSGKRMDMLSDMVNIAQVLQNLKRYKESTETAEKAASLSQELMDKVSLKNCYSIISENYEKQGNQAKAKEYFDLAASIRNQLQKEELQKYETRTHQAEAEVSLKNFEIELKESKIREINREKQLTLELLQKQKELNELKENEFKAKERLEEVNRRNTRLIIQSLIVILMLVVGSTIFILKQLREKKKAYRMLEESNVQVIRQKEEIEKQHEVVSSQKKKITDSIYYAKRIQHAVLPPVNVLERTVPDHFIFYHPRDIVSGDFYWFAEKDGVLVVAAADCTGHGVPGAFMSMLGIAFLNEIISKSPARDHSGSISANEILNELRQHVIVSLHQSGKHDEPKDGMDISLIILDLPGKQMQFAGAHNPVFVVRNGEPLLLEADKMSIGMYQEEGLTFTNQVTDLKDGDNIYLYSDGYYDQFGGPRGRKMLSGLFRNFLLTIHDKPMNEQRPAVENFYRKWKGSNEQIDDVMVIGLKIHV